MFMYPLLVGEQTLGDQAVGEVLLRWVVIINYVYGHMIILVRILLNVRAGSIYYWDKTNGTNNRAVALTDLAGANLAPTFALQNNGFRCR